jgi:hypothetical protein
MVAAARLSASSSVDNAISGSPRMAGAHGSRRMDRNSPVAPRPWPAEGFEFGVEELEVGHGLERPCKSFLLNRQEHVVETI